MRRNRAWTLTILAALTTGCGGDAPAPLAPDVEAVCSPLTISLEPGEGTLLPTADSTCVSFAEPGWYVAAFVDASAIESARGENPINSFRDDAFAVTVALHGAAVTEPSTMFRPPVVSATPVHPPESPQHLIAIAGGACDPADPAWCRDHPWDVGDRFESASANGLRTAIVTAIDGPLVMAVWEDEVEVVGPGLPAIESAFREGAREVVPFLRDTFVDELVTTSAGSGQLLVIVQEGSLSTAAWRTSDSGTSSLITLSLNPRVSHDILPALAVSILAHELAHAWQLRYAFRGNEEAGFYIPPWGLEGGATFVSQEYLRLRFGVTLDTNLPARSSFRLEVPEDVFWNQAHVSRGEFERGYHHAEPMLRHFMTRLIAAGSTESEAFAEVARGAVEGWFGNTLTGWRPPGISGRMEQATGIAWDAPELVLDWTVSQALDDRAPGEVYENPLIRDAWRTVGNSGFPPLARLGVSPVRIERPAGSTGYVDMTVPDDPLARLTLGTPSGDYGPPGLPPGVFPLEPTLRWMIVRFQ